MDELEIIAWLCSRVVLIALTAIYCVRGLDYLFLDFLHLIRSAGRLLLGVNLSVLRAGSGRITVEKRIAILLPSWRNPQVIRRTVHLLHHLSQYERFHVFVGVHKNDEPTRRAMREAAEAYPQLEPLSLPLPSPASRVDTLNHIYAAILDYERERGVTFDLFLMLRAGDVLHPQALNLVNEAAETAHLVQLPQQVLARARCHLAAGVLMDEWAERYGRELPVRAGLSSFLPAAESGYAVTREAAQWLCSRNYEKLFPQAPVPNGHLMGAELRSLRGRKRVIRTRRDATTPYTLAPVGPHMLRTRATPVAVYREVRAGLRMAVRDRARWLLGLAYAGSRWGGRGGPASFYLWLRDGCARVYGYTYLPLYALLGYGAFTAFRALRDPAFTPRPPVQPGEPYFPLLLSALGLLGWRAISRAVYVGRAYGMAQGALTVVRRPLFHLTSFAACVLAGHWWRRARRGAPVAERHDDLLTFPDTTLAAAAAPGPRAVGAAPAADGTALPREKLGDLLVRRGMISKKQLKHALKRQKETGQRLGEVLIESSALEEEDLVFALAEQKDEHAVELDPYATPPEILGLVPRSLAERYRVFPIGTENNTVILATDQLDNGNCEDELALLLGRPVQLHWTSTADIGFAIEKAYARTSSENVRLGDRLGPRLLREGAVSEADLKRALRAQKRTNKRLGEMLVEMEILSQDKLDDFLE